MKLPNLHPDNVARADALFDDISDATAFVDLAHNLRQPDDVADALNKAAARFMVLAEECRGIRAAVKPPEAVPAKREPNPPVTEREKRLAQAGTALVELVKKHVLPFSGSAALGEWQSALQSLKP